MTLLDDPMEVESTVETTALSLLETWVIEEQRLVTFNMLATQLSLDVNTAKSLLYTFVQSEKKRHETMNTVDAADRVSVECIYCISGQMSTNNKNALAGHQWQQVFKLVPDQQLQDVQSQFNKVTGIHVYAVTPGLVKDANTIAASMVQYNVNMPMNNTAPIKNRLPFVQKTQKITMAVHERRAPTGQVSMKPESERKLPTMTTVTRTPSSQTRPTTAAPTNNTATKLATTAKSRDASLFFAGHLNRPASKSTIDTKPLSTTSLMAAASKNKNNKLNKPTNSNTSQKTCCDEDSDEDEFVAPVEDKPEEGVALDSLFDTEMADIQPTPDTATIDNHENENENEDENDITNDTTSNDNSNDAISNHSNNSQTINNIVNNPSKLDSTANTALNTVKVKDEKRKRGRRRVTQRKTFKNERGYMVTEEVEAWESYSEDESESTLMSLSSATPKQSRRIEPSKKILDATTKNAPPISGNQLGCTLTP
ncbi:DNA polymerase subunit Cdc27 [Syncephalis fuscata]|nr:DNA polymerase subunit Cdc27 [Syncephalis fuscata]